jgi:hypothetical protein
MALIPYYGGTISTNPLNYIFLGTSIGELSQDECPHIFIARSYNIAKLCMYSYLRSPQREYSSRDYEKEREMQDCRLRRQSNTRVSTLVSSNEKSIKRKFKNLFNDYPKERLKE